MSTYSSRPWISKDGADDSGVRAEVKVVMGFGNIASVEASTAGKAQKVSFQVENTKFLSAGWAQTDSAVMRKVEEAKEAGEPLHFRIETRRKPNIDRTLPINEISGLATAKDSIVKSLAAVKREGDENWTIGQMVTRWDEDPKTSGNGVIPASEMSADELGKSTPAASAPANNYNGIEPPPFVTFNRDGELNPGSAAVGVLPNLLAFLAEWDREHDELQQVGEAKRVKVAKVLLMAANELQLKIFEGKLEKPDLSAGSHTRARGLLFEVIRSYFPISQEVLADKDSLLEWKNNLVEKSLGIWKWSMSEVESLYK